MLNLLSRLPFYKPTHRSVLFGLLLLLACTLLVFTGLGVFRLYFSFEWTPAQDSGHLFALRIRGGQSLNLFDAAPFGPVFWLTQSGLALLSLVMPWFTLTGAAIMASVTAMAVSLLHLYGSSQVLTAIPLEFELIIILVLLGLYAMMSYIAEHREQQRTAQLLSKFVPEELAHHYQRDPDFLATAGEEREVSVLFCDICHFSRVAQSLESESLARWLNLYFTHVSRIVVRHQGAIDKYMGDSVMAVWGAPLATTTHASDALAAAMEIQQELAALNRRYRSLGLPELSMGIGISTGPAMIGPLGSEHRMDYTVIGDTVNVAQHMETQTRRYSVPVIVSDKTAESLPEQLFRELDTVAVKGRDQAVTIYQPLGATGQASEYLMDRLNLHESAMQADAAGLLDEAVEQFLELRETWGPREMYDLYLQSIERSRRPIQEAVSWSRDDRCSRG